MNGLIVGVDKVNNGKAYRVVLFSYNNKQWEFQRQQLNTDSLKALIAGGKVRMLNVKLDGNKLKGLTGSLGRFENGINNPLVIVSELVADGRGVIGYKVANYDGTVKNVTVEDLIQHSMKTNQLGGIPIQNGQFVVETGGQRAHIRCYPGGDYIKEVIERKKSVNAKPATLDTDKNTKSLSKLEELFTPEQINELKIGKQKGVNIKVYGNNKLSAEQMRVVREGLQDGLDAKIYADPEYSVDAMRLLRADMKYGVDVSYYLNPKYSAEQLSELAEGFITGVDVSIYADPKNTPDEMAEIRMRLENNIWREHTVSADKSWE